MTVASQALKPMRGLPVAAIAACRFQLGGASKAIAFQRDGQAGRSANRLKGSGLGKPGGQDNMQSLEIEENKALSEAFERSELA